MDNLDNMDNIQNTFKRFRQNTPGLEVGADFEDLVFAGIKKKKKQRKVTASAALAIAFAGFLFIAQATVFHKPGKSPATMADGSNKQMKEEIPVVEDVVFASSDSQSNYVIEQVSYSEDDNTI